VVYVFAHWPKVICNKKSPCWILPTVEELQDSDHSTKHHAVKLPQPKIRPLQDNAQWYPSFSIIKNTLSKAKSKHYIQTVCDVPRKICGCVYPMTMKTPRHGKTCWANLSSHYDQG
jgi:hypothetical protein